MGNQASSVWGSLVRRPLQRYNVDHRAEKVMQKIKDPAAAPMRAPMYKSDADLLEHVRKTYPEIAKNSERQEPELYERLKAVYVESTDPAEEAQQPSSRRPLPRDIGQYSYDFVPAQLRLDTKDRLGRALPRGKVTMEQAVNFLTRYKETSGGFDHKAIAEEYRLNPETTKQATSYFHIFSMMETNTRKSEMTKPDPLIAGADWVKKVKDPQDPFGEYKKAAADMKNLDNRHKARVENERFLGEGKGRTE